MKLTTANLFAHAATGWISTIADIMHLRQRPWGERFRTNPLGRFNALLWIRCRFGWEPTLEDSVFGHSSGARSMRIPALLHLFADDQAATAKLFAQLPAEPLGEAL
jgi:hypothetical protein